MSDASLPLVAAHGIGVRRGGDVVLEGIDLAVEAGRIVTVVGPNGSGKTTLVRIVLGLADPDVGHVVRRPAIRTGYVPQHFSVDDTLPMTVRRFLALAAPGAGGRPRATLDEVGAGDLIDSPLGALSGGETKRVLLAQALLRDPDLLVLDEPDTGVDVNGQADLYALVQAIRERRGCGVLLVSHELHMVMAATDLVVCINHHVCCTGRPDAVSRHPEFLALFGRDLGPAFGVYSHHHDHHHDLAGTAVAGGAPHVAPEADRSPPEGRSGG